MDGRVDEVLIKEAVDDDDDRMGEAEDDDELPTRAWVEKLALEGRLPACTVAELLSILDEADALEDETRERTRELEKAVDRLIARVHALVLPTVIEEEDVPPPSSVDQLVEEAVAWAVAEVSACPPPPP